MITGTMNRLRAPFQNTAPRMRDRTRSINRRVFEIGQQSYGGPAEHCELA